MPFSKLRYHFIFATKNRARWIWPDVEEFLYPVLIRQTARAGGHVIRIGGVKDHVHMVSALKPKVCVSDFLERIKSESSQAVRRKFKNLWGFKWQVGFGAFSLNPLEMDHVIAYVENQKEHHRSGTLWLPYEQLTDKTSAENRSRKAHDVERAAVRAHALPDREARQRHKAIKLWGACGAFSVEGCPASTMEDVLGCPVGASRL